MLKNYLNSMYCIMPGFYINCFIESYSIMHGNNLNLRGCLHESRTEFKPV